MNIFKHIISLVGLFVILISPLNLCGEEESKEKKVINSLILVDESANQVLDLLEQLSGKSILRQQDLPKVKINLNSNGSITKKDAILALKSLLSMNGIAIIEMGDMFLKAVPSVGVQTQSPKLLTGSVMRASPSQEIYSKIFKLKFLSTKDGLAVIKGIATKDMSSQVALEKSNAILVVDSLMNLQRIETLFTEVDKPLALQEELVFYQIKHMDVADLKNQFEAMKKGSLKKYLENTMIEADKNSNQLIVLTHAGNKLIIDKIIESLDIDVQPLTRTQVYRLKYALAEEVSELIKALVKGVPMPKKEGGDARAQLLEKLRETVSKPSTAAPAAEKGQQFSQSLTLEPDERSNSIVAYGTPKDLMLVQGLIDEIDILLAQVQISVIIAEVTLTDDQVSGLETFGFAYNVPPVLNGKITNTGPQGKVRFFDAATPTTDALLTVATLLTGSFSPNAFQGLFQVAQQNTNVRILSAPMIVTMDNRPAIVKVVQDQPIVGESISDLANANNLRTATVYIKDVGIVLEVTPRIGPNNIIQMEIKQTVKNLLPSIPIATSTSSTISAPPIRNREASSYVSVRDQEVIVLAGLQQRISTNTKGKLWLLGYLPIVGDLLFSPESDTEVTTELVMFIMPHIMKNDQDVREVTCEALENNITSNEQVEHYIEYGHFAPNNPDPCEEPRKIRRHPCRPWSEWCN